MSNVGKWTSGHAGHTEPYCYGDSKTYEVGAAWLDGLSIEDWGCGLGGMRLFHKGDYIGIDGSASKFVDVIADLETYRPHPGPEGIFMRHVLEHNENWQVILGNALASFQKRMVLVLFTPFSETTRQIAWNVGYGDGVPDLSFARNDILDRISPYLASEASYTTTTQYHFETVFFLEKP